MDGGYTAISPELGGFTDFDALMRVANRCGVELALDIAFQCSPDHPWVKSHPDWFSIRPDGSIERLRLYWLLFAINSDCKEQVSNMP
jgi:starch synthase (maltosyl-transferring)